MAVRPRQRGHHGRGAARRRGDDGELNRPLPATLRLAIDPRTRRTDGGRVLIGGSPLRILRLTAAGARAVDGLSGGDPVGAAPTRQWLARRLLHGGLAHPRPAGARTSTTAPPGVAVVIPVRDRPAGLAATLAAFVATGVAAGRRTGADRASAGSGPSGPGSVEVVVVDDGSVGPGTAGVASAAGARVVRHDASRGPAAARNRGVRETGAELVAFVDADCVPTVGWLAPLVDHFADPEVGAVAPRITPLPATGAPSWILAYERLRFPLDRGGQEAPVRPGGTVPFVPAAALVVRRSALEEVGGFDEQLRVGEDVDLVWRLAAAGWTVRYEPAATVGHPVRPDTRSWLAQRFAYGTSAAPLAARHGRAVAPVVVSAWSAAAWGLVALRRPLAGVAVAGATTALLARKLRDLEHPWREAGRLAGRGHLGAGRVLADGVRRAWWPLAVPAGLAWRRTRPAVAVAVLGPPLREWVTERPPLGPLAWTAARLADDLAYGAGVWTGALRARSAACLVPDLTNWPGRRPAVER